MDEDDFDNEAWLDNEPSEPSDLGFDPYAGGYVDDDPIDPFEDYGTMIGGDSDLMNEW